jgi:hypothetical protein
METPVCKPYQDLTKEARQRFPNLTECEKTMLRKVLKGDIAQCGPSHSYKDPVPSEDPAQGQLYDVRASLLRWLIVDCKAAKLVDPRGIDVNAARIVDSPTADKSKKGLDLSFVVVPFPLAFTNSRFADPIDILDAHVPELLLEGTRVPEIIGKGITVQGSVDLNGVQSDGDVNLREAMIGGDLFANDGGFVNRGKEALSAEKANVVGSVSLQNFYSEGLVQLGGAKIGGNLEADGGNFFNPTGIALSADRIHVNGNVFLGKGFYAEGEVWLADADIGLNLDCGDGHFENASGPALTASRAHVKGVVALDKVENIPAPYRAPGQVIFQDNFSDFDSSWGVPDKIRRAESGSMVIQPQPAIGNFYVSLNNKYLYNDLDARVTVELRGKDDADAFGGVIFWARDPGNYYFAGYDGKGRFEVDQVVAGKRWLQIPQLTTVKPGASNELEIVTHKTDNGAQATIFVNGNLVTPTPITGQPPSKGTRIGLFASGRDSSSLWQFNNLVVAVPSKDAVAAHSTPALESPPGWAPPWLGFHSNGIVDLSEANIDGDLVVREARFAGRSLFHAEGATVKGAFFFQQVKLDPEVRVNLIDATVGPLYDDAESWPKQPEPGREARLVLDGFVYSRFGNLVPAAACGRLEWLGRHCAPTWGQWLTAWVQSAKHEIHGSKEKQAVPVLDFKPQPYEQLAKVLRDAGDDNGATQVLIEMENARREADLAKLPWHSFKRISDPFLYYTVGYGYRPQWGLRWSLAFIFFGWFAFRWGYNEGAIAPYHPLSYEISKRDRGSRSEENPEGSKNKRPNVPDYDPPFSPLWYSLDNFLPLVDLRQKDRWMPDLHSDREAFRWFKGLGERVFGKTKLGEKWKRSEKWKLGWWLRLYVWALTLFGWLLSSLILAAVTGIIHQ